MKTYFDTLKAFSSCLEEYKSQKKAKIIDKNGISTLIQIKMHQKAGLALCFDNNQLFLAILEY